MLRIFLKLIPLLQDFLKSNSILHFIFIYLPRAIWLILKGVGIVVSCETKVIIERIENYLFYKYGYFFKRIFKRYLKRK